MAAVKTFYILHGEDEYSLKVELKAIRSKMGDPTLADLNTTLLDGKSTNAVEVLSAAGNFPFMGDKRLVIVEGLLTWITRKGAGKTGKADMELLTNGIPSLPDSTRLVFVEYESLEESHPLVKLARTDPHGYVKHFEPPRDTVPWINKRVQDYGGQIEPGAAVALAGVMNGDLRAIESECYKLLTFVGFERPITEADIALMTSYVPETNVFDIVDAVAKQDGVQALKLIHRVLETTKQEPLMLLGMINRQFRLLLQIREVLDMGANPRQLGDLQRLPGGKKEFLIRQAQVFSLEQLEQIYHRLAEYDYEIKTGQVSDDLALDLLVAGLTA
ncbi:MAG: DNA polymerase III subunit delta [Anaerolineae bacterium]|nr:DNA polymerase III subunit delta [Anaerolineae bacterium]